ncbi:MAG: nucleotidyltransferase [Lachnospiraceae bacterium]|nr:nucleotidyltransferase [Lachnospiraceae bacterium]
MRETVLVIMAAGIGSRFGGGIKQLEPVGPNGEIIMDYSIHDALEAGFNKVIFIIRKDIEKDFKEVIGNRMEKNVKCEYVFQEIDDLPEGFSVPEGRVKPWGTGQAVLCCKEILKDPFVVINADDYYGKEAFVKVHDYLVNIPEGQDKLPMCMAGFILGNTLSENGAVTRGVARIDENHTLLSVDETSGIERKGNKVIAVDEEGNEKIIDPESYASMNMWGLTPKFMDVLEDDFRKFLSHLGDKSLKKEFLLPIIIDQLIREKKAEVKVLETRDRWFGVTYKKDKESVMDSFQQLIAEGIYSEKLYG